MIWLILGVEGLDLVNFRPILSPFWPILGAEGLNLACWHFGPFWELRDWIWPIFGCWGSGFGPFLAHFRGSVTGFGPF